MFGLVDHCLRMVSSQSSSGAAVLGLVVPVALLEADDAEAGLGEAERRTPTGRAGADDEDVRGFGCQG